MGAIVSGCLLSFSARADFEDVPLTPAATATPEPTVAPTAGEPAGANAPAETPRPTTNPTAKETQTAPAGSTKPAPGKSTSGRSSPASLPASAAAQNDDGSLDHNSSAPVSYSAQSLEGSLTQGRVLLKGDVQIEQADAVMKSDVAEIFSNKGGTTPQRAVAKGRVSLNKPATATTQELRAVAQELEYFMRGRRVILKGKPKIWRGRELLQGEVIEVFLDTNEIKVRGARGVMEPATSPQGAAGNSQSPGVQNAPAKKSSQTGRR